MIAIGIDMSKLSFHAAFDDKKVSIFKNTDEGIEAFVHATELCDAAKEATTIGVEATGAYHLLFAIRLTKLGWRVNIINPLESYRFATSQSIRKVKNDKRDALMLRKMILAGRGHRFTDTEEVLALKALVVDREGLVAARAMMKQRNEAGGAKQKAINFTMHDSRTPIIKALNHEIRAIEKKFGAYEAETQKLLRSIPGIGVSSAAALVAYVGDVKRFSSPEKLTAYIGLDCRVFQSGTSIQGRGYISKRGNACLRRSLWNAAFIARQRIPYLKTYFEKKRKEGKHYCIALCAIERKLIHLVYAVWTRGTPYELRESTDTT